MHSCIVLVKVRNGFRLEHHVIRDSITTKGFGEHLSKQGWKASMIDIEGSVVKFGCFERAIHGFGVTS